MDSMFYSSPALRRMKPETDQGRRAQNLYSETRAHICFFKHTNLIQIVLIYVNALDSLNNFAWWLFEPRWKGVFPLKPVWQVLSLPLNLFTNICRHLHSALKEKRVSDGLLSSPMSRHNERPNTRDCVGRHCAVEEIGDWGDRYTATVNCQFRWGYY